MSLQHLTRHLTSWLFSTRPQWGHVMMELQPCPWRLRKDIRRWGSWKITSGCKCWKSPSSNPGKKHLLFLNKSLGTFWVDDFPCPSRLVGCVMLDPGSFLFLTCFFEWIVWMTFVQLWRVFLRFIISIIFYGGDTHNPRRKHSIFDQGQWLYCKSWSFCQESHSFYHFWCISPLQQVDDQRRFNVEMVGRNG